MICLRRPDFISTFYKHKLLWVFYSLNPAHFLIDPVVDIFGAALVVSCVDTVSCELEACDGSFDAECFRSMQSLFFPM
jgi:hypothetical protein